MSLSVGCHLREPGAGNHDAGGGHGAAFKRVEAGGILGMSDGEIVGINEEKFAIARIPQRPAMVLLCPNAKVSAEKRNKMAKANIVLRMKNSIKGGAKRKG